MCDYSTLRGSKKGLYVPTKAGPIPRLASDPDPRQGVVVFASDIDCLGVPFPITDEMNIAHRDTRWLTLMKDW